MLTIQWHGQTLRLLPERALLWVRTSSTASRSAGTRGGGDGGVGDGGGGVLILADLHLGKPAAFRAAGIPVPEAIGAELDELTRLIDRHNPDALLIAGDLLHAREGRSDHVLQALRDWRARHSALDIILVRGNHDLGAGDPPAELGIQVVNEPFALHPTDPIAFAHDPAAAASADRPIVCGHLHPSITLGDGRTSLRAPCFWVRPRTLVLPARGRFTGTRGISPSSDDRVFVACDSEVIEARAPTASSPVTVGRRRSTVGRVH